jgi:molybdopterin-binding protein
VGALTAEVTPGSVERLGIRPGLKVVASWKATSTRVVPRPDGRR